MVGQAARERRGMLVVAVVVALAFWLPAATAAADTLDPGIARALSRQFDDIADSISAAAIAIEKKIAERLRDKDPNVGAKFDKAMAGAKTLDQEIEAVEKRLKREAGLPDQAKLPDSLQPADRPKVPGPERDSYDHLTSGLGSFVRAAWGDLWTLRALLKALKHFRELAKAYGDYGGREATGDVPILPHHGN